MTNLDHLPEHLRSISRVHVDRSMLDAPLSRRALERLKGLPVEIVEEGAGPVRDSGQGHVLHLKRYKGEFLRFCPGTRYYHCCGYRIAHIGENCPLSCSYCILQAYFQDRTLKVWANQDDLFAELGNGFAANPGQRFRIGTGEFTDSLALEALTGYAGDLVEFLGNHANVCLELKSKIVDLSWMDRVRRPDRVLPAWSMNAPEIVQNEERGASSLEERLAAARTCAEAGFRVCLHFDPIIRFPGWERGYDRTVEMIRDHLKPEQVAYISLGSFRHMPELKEIILRNHPGSDYVFGEFIRGRDNKMRLLRPQRIEQFKRIARGLEQCGFGEALYFCMESDEVWTSVFDRTPKDFGGLSAYLMNRAFAGR